MPEPAQHVQPNIDAELVPATVLFWNGRFGFARADRGGAEVYIGARELVRARIARLEVGGRVCFEVRQATHGRKPWAAHIRLAEPTA